MLALHLPSLMFQLFNFFFFAKGADKFRKMHTGKLQCTIWGHNSLNFFFFFF